MTGTDEDAPERDVELLLPWHAAGTLNRHDAQRVEQALTNDPELARRYALVRAELSETVRLNESLGAPSTRAMENLFARINAEPNQKPAFFKPGAWLTGLLDSVSPRALAWSASIALFAILLQSALIAEFVLTDNRPASFETASAPGVTFTKGAFVLIRFAPHASIDDINTFLEANKLSIVAGPAPGGLYKVRVAETEMPGDALDRTVKTLQNNKVVAFIGAAQ